MGRMVRKGDLPTKPCAACGRPFAWRRKWERVWDEVLYCSDRCRGARRPDDRPHAEGGDALSLASGQAAASRDRGTR